MSEAERVKELEKELAHALEALAILEARIEREASQSAAADDEVQRSARETRKIIGGLSAADPRSGKRT